MLTVAVIGLSACSDARSSSELDLSNRGFDPTTLVILAPGSLTATLRELGDAFTSAHPNITILLVSDVVNSLHHYPGGRGYKPLVVANARESLDADIAPSLWIDTSMNLRTLLPADRKTWGVKLLFGREGIALVVKPGNPDGVTGLSDFAEGSPVKTGVCFVHTVCGSLARATLAKAHITSHASISEGTGAGLIADLLQSRVQAALTASSDAAEAGATVSVVPIRPPSTTFVTYQMLRLDGSPTAKEFAGWLVTTHAAEHILAEHGFVRTTVATP